MQSENLFSDIRPDFSVILADWVKAVDIRKLVMKPLGTRGVAKGIGKVLDTD